MAKITRIENSRIFAAKILEKNRQYKCSASQHFDRLAQAYIYIRKLQQFSLYAWTLRLCSILINSGLLWSTMLLYPISRASIFSISSRANEKSQISKFCSMRSLCTVLGITTTPRWIFQCSATWAAVRHDFHGFLLMEEWMNLHLIHCRAHLYGFTEVQQSGGFGKKDFERNPYK